MLIEFRNSDRMLGLKALGIYEKGIDAATAACEKVYVPTLELQTAKASSETAGTWVAQHLDEMGIGEVRDLDIPMDLALTLRTASSVYIGQLSKLSEKQADLLVPIEDTNVLMSQLQSFADRLNGQTEISSVFSTALHDAFDAAADEASDDGTATVQFSSGGRTSKRVTMDALNRAVDNLKGR